jgi:hypothetical protein
VHSVQGVSAGVAVLAALVILQQAVR